MVLKFRSGVFRKPVTAAPFNLTIPIGFRTKAFIVYGAYDIGDSLTPADRYRMHMGFGNGVDYEALATASSDNATPSVVNEKSTINKLISLVDTTSTVYLEATISEITDEDITLNFSINSSAVDRPMAFMALGGDDIKQTHIGTTDLPLAGNTVSEIDPGFKPDVVIFLVNHHSVHGQFTTSHFGVGFATADLGQGCVSVVSENARNPSDTWRMQRRDKCVASLDTGTGAVDTFATLTSMDAQGFTLTTSASPPSTPSKISYLAIRGGRYKIKEVVLDAGVGPGDPQAMTGIGFKTEGIFMITDDSITLNPAASESHSKFAMGSADKFAALNQDSGQVATCASEEDGVTPTQVASVFKSGRVLYGVAADNATASACTIEFDASLQFFTSDGFSLLHNIKPGNDVRVLTLSFGSTKPYKSMSLASKTNEPTAEISMSSKRMTVFG